MVSPYHENRECVVPSASSQLGKHQPQQSKQPHRRDG